MGNTLYVPFAQHYEPNLVIFARTSAPPDVALQALRTAVRQVDPDLGIGMSGAASLLLAGPLVMARLLGSAAAGLGGLTLLLSMVGLYGVLAQSVAQRTQETGVRLSLGATAAQIEWLVFRQGLRPVIEGFAIGVLFGVGARLAVRAVLVAPIDPFDPLAVAVVSIPLCAVTFLACYMPARRAASVDPNAVLRQL
jgi:predicted lysophospholipase L1 biosynthesis ABC-type transport system permease subunit